MEKHLFKNIKVRYLESCEHSGAILRNMAMLASGSVASKIIGTLSIPIITRIYSPEHLGYLSIFLSMVVMLAPLATFLYSTAIPLPKNDCIAANLVCLCIIILIFTLIIFSIIFKLSSPYIYDLLAINDILKYWWLVPVSIFGSGFYDVVKFWALREKAFKAMSKSLFSQSLIGSTVKIILGLLGFKPLGLLLGQAVTQSFGLQPLFKIFKIKLYYCGKFISYKRIKFLLNRYSDYPKYRLPSQILLMVSSRAPLFYFSWRFGVEDAGQLGLALMMIAMPMTLFGQSTGHAYFAEISKIGRKNSDKIYRITKDVTYRLLFMSIGPFIVILLGGPIIFQIVFGSDWSEAGLYTSIMSFYLLMQFISNPLISVLNIYNEQKLFFKMNLFRLIGVLIVFFISFILQLNPHYTIILYSIFLFMNYILISYSIFRIIKIKLI